jgi:hypothetical protein
VLGAGGHMGSMPHWLVMKNTQLMAEEVIPHFRAPDGKPSWMREEPLGPVTLTEHAATVGKPDLQPVARLNGSLEETRRAYLEEMAET